LKEKNRLAHRAGVASSAGNEPSQATGRHSRSGERHRDQGSSGRGFPSKEIKTDPSNTGLREQGKMAKRSKSQERAKRIKEPR